MSENKLKTAVLGLNEKGRSLLEAAWQSEYYQVKAVADSDAELSNKLADRYDCENYSDYRQLIIQDQFDVLLVAAPSHTCAEHIQAAMRKKINVLKLAPAGPNFEKAVEFVKLAENEGVKFGVVNLRRFAESFRAAQDYIKQNNLEQIYLITAFCAFAQRSGEKWHSDPELAGGGVLLYPCYEMIDRIIANFSIPQQVYSLNLNQAPDKLQRSLLTEEVAVITMKFSDRLIGNLIASEVFGPVRQELRIYDRNGSLAVTDERLIVFDRLGEVLEEFNYEYDGEKLTIQLLDNFAQSIITGQRAQLYGGAAEILPTMAFIEAAYLSARTAMPEEPERVLQRGYPAPINIWPTY
jgi:predicted dehydrogenase